MENANVILFCCLIVPLGMMLLLVKDRARQLIGFLIYGIVMCLLAGELNGLILHKTELTEYYISVNIAPIIEECLKAALIIAFAYFAKPDRQFLIESSLAIGVGFATLENCCILMETTQRITIGWALVRSFGAGLMHSVCTLAVGYAMSFINDKNKRRLAHPATVAALAAAIIYHSIYNILVQSSGKAMGILLPVVTYVALIFIVGKQKKTVENRT